MTICFPHMRGGEPDTGASVQSGCALLWTWFVGIVVIALAALVALAVLGAVMAMGGI